MGLPIGKPAGSVLLSFIAISFAICRLLLDLAWRHILGSGLLGRIGFTMSIFIPNLAFAGQADVINASKMAILLASPSAGDMGKPLARDTDPETKNFESRLQR